MPRSGKIGKTPQSLVPVDDQSGPSPAFDAAAYNKVARAAKLRRISLLRSDFFVLPEYFAAKANNRSLSSRYTAGFGEHHVDSKGGLASCEWEWGIKIIDKRKATLSIDVAYVVVYGGIEECIEEQVIRYMRRVGRFATYPYFRAHVSQLSWESGVNLPILPTIAT